jgi:hypothetical protein
MQCSRDLLFGMLSTHDYCSLVHNDRSSIAYSVRLSVGACQRRPQGLYWYANLAHNVTDISCQQESLTSSTAEHHTLNKANQK